MNGRALTYLTLTIVFLAGDVLVRLTAGPGSLLAPYVTLLLLFGAVLFTVLTHLALDDGEPPRDFGAPTGENAAGSQ